MTGKKEGRKEATAVSDQIEGRVIVSISAKSKWKNIFKHSPFSIAQFFAAALYFLTSRQDIMANANDRYYEMGCTVPAKACCSSYS
jgi:hypothetical protein